VYYHFVVFCLLSVKAQRLALNMTCFCVGHALYFGH